MMLAHAPLNRILIAVDSPVESLSVESMLHSAQLGATRVTSDSREIVPLLRKWPYRLLVLDSNIRPRTAEQVLVDLEPWIQELALTVLVITPKGDGDTLDNLMAHGALDVIPRPVRRDDLLMHVRWCLRAVKAAPDRAGTTPLAAMAQD